MLTFTTGNHSSQLDHPAQLTAKILLLAQELLLDEMFQETIFSCGDSFTHKFTGRYGVYETFNGEVIAFQPQLYLNYTLTAARFVISGNLAMIKTVCHHLEDYELTLSR